MALAEPAAERAAAHAVDVVDVVVDVVERLQHGRHALARLDEQVLEIEQRLRGGSKVCVVQTTRSVSHAWFLRRGIVRATRSVSHAFLRKDPIHSPEGRGAVRRIDCSLS